MGAFPLLSFPLPVRPSFPYGGRRKEGEEIGNTTLTGCGPRFLFLPLFPPPFLLHPGTRGGKKGGSEPRPVRLPFPLFLFSPSLLPSPSHPSPRRRAEQPKGCQDNAAARRVSGRRRRLSPFPPPFPSPFFFLFSSPSQGAGGKEGIFPRSKEGEYISICPPLRFFFFSPFRPPLFS